MSRRETVINALLGSLLVLAFFLPFLGLLLATYLLDLFTARFFPGITTHWNIAFGAIIAGLLLVEMVDTLRRHCWRDAFLKFACASAFSVIVVSDLRFGNSLDTFWILVPMLFFGNMSRKSSDRKDIGRSQFFLSLITLSVLFAVEAGLLGAGLFSHIVKGCTYIALLVWFAIRARRGWAQENDGPTISSASAAG